MKTREVLIATALIILASTFLTSCELIESKAPTTSTVAPAETRKLSEADKSKIEILLEKAEAAKKDVKLVFDSKKEEGKVVVSISLKNSNQKPVNSVQSWLSFDVSKLQGKEINTSESDFELMAPYPNTFDNINGLVMVGRSNSKSITEQNIEVVEIVFDVVKDGTTNIDAYDYRNGVDGHTSANTLIDGETFNILLKPESPALVVEN